MGTTLRHHIHRHLTSLLGPVRALRTRDDLGVAMAGLGKGVGRRMGQNSAQHHHLGHLTPGKCFNHSEALGTL